MKNEIISLKLKADSKNQSIDYFKPSHQSPKNSKKLFQNRKKPNTIINETMKRNKENSLKKYNNNLNSFTSEINNLQSLIYQSETYETNINSNILNNILQKNSVLSTANKVKKLNPQNKKNEKKKQTVNLSKNIEEIIKRRILDNKNIKTNSLQKRNNNHNKKLKFANSHAITSKELKGNKSFGQKENTVNKNNSTISNNNKNENCKIDKEKKSNYKSKYFETRRLNMYDKSNNDDNMDINIDNDKNDDDEDKDKLIHMEYLNSNTDNIKNETVGNIFDNANSFRGMNYDYDSCFEEENRPKKTKVVKSLNRSKHSKNISNEKEEFYTYDTINQEFISIIDDNKNCLDKNDINISNEIIDKTNSDGKLKEKIDISKDNDNDNEIDNKIKENDKKVNQNDSIVNTNDFSTNTNINSERYNLSNNSAPKIKESNKSKKDVENIKKIISNTIKNINSSLNTSNLNEVNNIQENIKKHHINLTEIKSMNYLKSDSSIKPSSILDALNNNSNKKPNIYAPKKVGNHLSVKNNINDELLESNKKKNNNINIIIDENSEKENSDKEKNIYSHRITYTKKIPNVYFQKNFTSSKNKSDKDKEYSLNELKKKNIKNRLNFPKLNSSYEGTNNLQMNNIFMNNNVFNNNFNYPLGIGLSDPYANKVESSNNFICSNNACYKFKNNNNIFYDINNPSTQYFFQNVNNNNNINNNQNINKFKIINNSFDNEVNNNKIISGFNNEFFTENIKLNYPENDLFNYINFEDFIILKERMVNIKNALSRKNLINNECFEYLNYYYNSSVYNNFEHLFANCMNINNLKICLGYKLLSIFICYNCSLDINVFEQTHLLLKEIMDLNYKNIILLFEYIFENVLHKNDINSNNNLWLFKIENSIISYRKYEEKTYNENISLNNNSNISSLEKLKINTNFIMNNINTILSNIKTKNNDYLITIFKSMNEKLYKNIFFYFFNYILNISNIQGSIVGSTLFQNQISNNRNLIIPYIKTKNIKKYSLVLDLEETLIHFHMNSSNNFQGVVDIRPGTIKLLDDISEYYELIVFNEGEQKYTDLLIDSLEQNKIYFEHRFYREHITTDNNDIIKDLVKIGRPLDKILIIDNMPQNFKLQKNNGIMIKSFWGNDPNDNILSELSIILTKIAEDGGDIRNGLIKYKNEIINKIMIGNSINI